MSGEFTFKYHRLADNKTALKCERRAIPYVYDIITQNQKRKYQQVQPTKMTLENQQQILEDLYKERMKHGTRYMRQFNRLPKGLQIDFQSFVPICANLTCLHLDMSNAAFYQNNGYEWLDFQQCTDIRGPLHTIVLKGKLKNVSVFLRELHCEKTLQQLFIHTSLDNVVDYYELGKMMNRHTRLRVLKMYDKSFTHRDLLNIMCSTCVNDFHVQTMSFRPLNNYYMQLNDSTKDMIRRTRVEYLDVDNLMKYKVYRDVYFQRLQTNNPKLYIEIDNTMYAKQRDQLLSRKRARDNDPVSPAKRSRLEEVMRLLKTL